MFRIPVYAPSLAGNERRNVIECIDSTWISSKGKFIPEFEGRFAEYVGARHAIAVTNGTIALHLALVALGIGPGDEVILPTLTYVASANAISYTGATPVFVDSVASTWQMDPADVRRKITPRTRAIMPVHLYGHPCDMRELVSIAKEHGLFVVEDCAEAIGSRIGDQHVGTFGDIGIFSFFGNKTITTGEGGMVVTNDETLSTRLSRFKGQGLAAHREYWHDIIGYNYRMTNICAAIGVAQMERIDDLVSRKSEIAEKYRSIFHGSPIIFHEKNENVIHSYWMCSILIPDAKDRDPLRRHLADAGIETRPVFYPVHTMPMYASRFERHAVAEDIGWRGINLPSWPDLTDAQVNEIADIVLAFARRSL